MQPEPGKCLHAERQQRFADVKPRKLFALEENHAASGAREQRRGRAAGRSASNDRDVVHAAAHCYDGSVARTAFKERRLPSHRVKIDGCHKRSRSLNAEA